MVETVDDVATMWEDYSRTKSPELKRLIAMEYTGIVRFVVSKFRSYSRQASSVIEENDLMQLGMIGLLDSIDRFDPTRGVKFETYAITRIRGSVQDELRKLDWVPRSVREKVRALDRVTQKIECNDTLSGSSKKIASELHMSLDEYRAMLLETQLAIPELVTQGDNGEDILDNIADQGQTDVGDRVADQQVKKMLTRLIENLPHQDRLVISLYYYEEMTFKEIASVLRLSESRVFQKHAAILERIRGQVGSLLGKSSDVKEHTHEKHRRA
jgi:RNA polymerase sigma factor for flagellar operon FliA